MVMIAGSSGRAAIDMSNRHHGSAGDHAVLQERCTRPVRHCGWLHAAARRGVGRVARRVGCYADGMRMQVPGPRSDRRIDPEEGYLAEGAEGEPEASFARTPDASSHCRPTLGESIVAGRRPVRIRGGPDTRTRSTNLIPVARSDGPVRPRNKVAARPRAVLACRSMAAPPSRPRPRPRRAHRHRARTRRGRAEGTGMTPPWPCADLP